MHKLFVKATVIIVALMPALSFALVESRNRPVSTYSIVARDSVTGQMGVAVQSHWFSVGPIVPWAEAGVGAIATQSFVKVEYGPAGLDRLREGQVPSEALSEMLSGDEGADVRQVGIVDAHGRVAAHTGARCIAYAGHQTGAGFSVQANLMADSTVPAAMAEAYTKAEGSLAERLLSALRAAEGEHGDIRGRQSAAILIVSGKRQEASWKGRLVDLRVEDHPHPVEELTRVYKLHTAYEWMNKGDFWAETAQWDSAAVAYGQAEKIAPDIPELPFWHAVTLAAAGRVEESLPIFRHVFVAERRWVELVPRLVPSGLLPDDPDLLERILNQADR